MWGLAGCEADSGRGSLCPGQGTRSWKPASNLVVTLSAGTHWDLQGRPGAGFPMVLLTHTWASKYSALLCPPLERSSHAWQSPSTTQKQVQCPSQCLWVPSNRGPLKMLAGSDPTTHPVFSLGEFFPHKGRGGRVLSGGQNRPPWQGPDSQLSGHAAWPFKTPRDLCPPAVGHTLHRACAGDPFSEEHPAWFPRLLGRTGWQLPWGPHFVYRNPDF